MAELNVRLVAVDGEIWNGPATSVVAKTVEGEIGILPGHEPVLALLADGEVRIKGPDGTTRSAAVHGGFFAVDQDEVAILGETAELAEQIDVARAQAALERARAADQSDPVIRDAAKRAEVRIALAQKQG